MFSQESIHSTDIKVLQGVEYRLCLCGQCDELVRAKDACGRAIKYRPGHNRRGKRAAKKPIVVTVNRIQSLDEAKSHLVTTGVIMGLKDECNKCMHEYIIKLEGLLNDNKIQYERTNEINECMQQQDTAGF